MRDIKEIQKKIDYEKKIAEQLKGSFEGSIDYVRWSVAVNLVNALEWVIKLDYPKGAIKSISELMSYKGKTIYAYSVKSSWANESFRFSGLVTNDTGNFVPYKEGMEFRFIQGGVKNEIISLRDMHIIPQNYNDWFLFGNKEDAEAYLKGNVNENR